MEVYDQVKRKLDEARALYQKAGVDADFPKNHRCKKWVRAGGNLAYEAVEHAMNELLFRRGVDVPERIDIWFYCWHVGNYDKALFRKFENAYDMLAVAAGLRGISSIAGNADGVELAEEIIELLKDWR